MRRMLGCLALLLGASNAIGQVNTTPFTSANYFWGQKATSFISGPGNTQFWFELDAYHGRSYCVEAGNFESTYGDRFIDPVVTIYQSDGSTQITQSDDVSIEPTSPFLSRACWIHNRPSEHIYVKLSPATPGVPASSVTLRFVETTLYCPWFFIAGDYNAFSLLRNTASGPLSILVQWRGLNGTVAGSVATGLAADGTIVLNARDFVLNPAVFSNGSVEVAHDGGPDQLQGSTTTLSGTTGLGFDAAFTQRRPW